jgi:hypothetical protein
VNLIVIDLIPALLSWEGRDRSQAPSTAPNAMAAIEHLASHFELTGIADAGHTGAGLRHHLERDHLALYFSSIGTSAPFGPSLSPRVLRRLTAAMKLRPSSAVVVTARPTVAADMTAARIRTVGTTHEEFEFVDEAVETLLSGRFSP